METAEKEDSAAKELHMQGLKAETGEAPLTVITHVHPVESWYQRNHHNQQELVVVAVVTLVQWDPHRCNRAATVSYTPGTAELAGTAEQPH
jgi:hypothetical protein